MKVGFLKHKCHALHIYSDSKESDSNNTSHCKLNKKQNLKQNLNRQLFVKAITTASTLN